MAAQIAQSPHRAPIQPATLDSMAVALWALGDDEAELAEWLATHGMLPVGQPVHGITARARLMQRCEPRGDDGEPEHG
jgi:hypothetical protein